MSELKPWIDIVSLHPDVISEDFSEDIFALDLGQMVEGNPNVPAVYRDAESFFKASYITSGLKSLLSDVLGALSGKSGERVLKLMTPFGGGKSHTLAALYHSAKHRNALNTIPEAEGLPKPKDVEVAVFDGQMFDISTGKVLPNGQVARTLWGWIAWCLGKEEAYNRIKTQDENLVAPGGDVISQILSGSPKLILLDEVLHYLIGAGGIKVQDTTLREQTLLFLQNLIGVVSNTKNTALVYSLQSSKRESLDYIGLLKTVDHMTSRKDQLREPVKGDEIMLVIQRRLLAKLPTHEDSTPAAEAYADVITAMRRAYASTPQEQQQAEEDRIELRDRIRKSYPFHPALIDLMRERWASIPDFQRTRGALRFLAACLRSCYQNGKSFNLLGPGEVPLEDSEARLAFFKEVGQREDFQAMLENDLIGNNAWAKRIDKRKAEEDSSWATKKAAMRVATTILMYSFGGLAHESGDGNEILPPGIKESELFFSTVSPELDSTTVNSILKELDRHCLYLDFDEVRYCFKKDPNEKLLIEQESETLSKNENLIKETIRELLEKRLSGNHDVIVWPDKNHAIPDEEPQYLFAYMPFDFALKTSKEQISISKEFFEKYGDRPRRFRNGLALVIPTKEQIDILSRSIRYVMATDRIMSKKAQLRITRDQEKRIKERKSTEEQALESSLIKIYCEVWFPRQEDGSIGIKKIQSGGRPLQTTYNANRQAAIHERIIELVSTVNKEVFYTVQPYKMLDLFKIGAGDQEKRGIKLRELIDGFYSFLGYTRLKDKNAIKKSIVEGVEEGVFGYYHGQEPTLDPSGLYQVDPKKVIRNDYISMEEIDFDYGHILVPEAIPKLEEETPPESPEIPEPPETPSVSESTIQFDSQQKDITLSFSADSEQLFKAWNALANLAEKAGTVSVTINAHKEEGFDKNWLRNAVIEPLEEEDLI